MLPAGWGGTSSVTRTWARPGLPTQIAAPQFEVSYPATPESLIYDMPCVVRRSVSGIRLTTQDNGYDEFMKALRSRANRRILSGLPKSLSGLKDLPLPPKLAKLFEQLAHRHSEAEIVVAFYQALLEYDGKGQFDQSFQKKIEAIIGKSSPTIELVVEVVARLNNLRNDRGPLLGPERYDIPAFMRKQQD